MPAQQRPPISHQKRRGASMIQFMCDSCGRVKEASDAWIVGRAAEAVGVTAARREVTIQSAWDRATALHRQKTSDPSNREHKNNLRGAKSRCRAIVLKKGHSREGLGKEPWSRQAQTLERGASGSATRIRHDGQFECGNV